MCLPKATWLRRILEELGHVQQESTIVYCDNSSAIKLSKNPVMHGRSKHIDVRFHFLREFTKDGIVTMVHCQTQKQVADIMTKPLKLDAFLKMRVLMGVCLDPDLTEEFIAGALKIGGIAAVQVTDDMSDSFRIPLYFKIVHLRRLDPIVLAMRKIGSAAGTAALTGQRRGPLLAEDCTKRGAVEGLEDLLLELPRVAAVRRHRYGRRTK
ncbi:hypothetical protein CKAN_00790100 [Cinnamomum micranthum f. kanehirae]|uniref:Retrovirus-related Pol polyprotein from transposon TNT 1-94 n=1 Tax=Cinnamomum micranthum f. kanehirae TaxID=337451 RepID=A0A443NLF9_9MAGN|nr:hypothetical protein CKAN_00790100 [Cinnamomum micranthum f. kanehirae]